MPAKMVTWDELPDVVKQMDPDERESFLLRNNAIMMPRGVAPPPNAILSAPGKEANIDTSSADVMGFGPGLTHPENRKDMAKSGAAAASTLAGGGGPMAAIISGALNAKYGPDVNSGRGVAENVANVAFGRLNPMVGPMLNKGSSIAQGAKNFLAGAGQVGATQAAGTALSGEDQDIGSLLATGAIGGVGQAAANRLLKAVEKSTPIVRQKLQPFLSRLTPAVEDPPPMPNPPAVAQVPNPTAPAADEAVDPFTQKIRQTVDYIQKRNPELYEPAVPSVSAQSSQNDDIEEKLRQSLIAMGKDPASLPPPTPKPAAAAPVADIPTPASAPDITLTTLDEMAAKNPKASAFSRLGGKLPSEYIEATVGGKDWSTLPDVMREMDAAFPDGQFRDAIRQKITEKVLSGVGTAGEFGDLSPLQRVQAFGKQKFGEKTGAQVINQIFDSPEAYRNLSDMQEIIEASGRGPKDESTIGKLKIFWNNSSPVIGLGGGALTAYLPVIGAAGKVAAVAGTVKALTITADAVAEYLGKKNSKWADVLYDMATGGNRYSAQSISNVISGLRRRAVEERDLTPEEYASELGGR